MTHFATAVTGIAEATRLSNTVLPSQQPEGPSLLMRIYPLQGLEAPVQVSTTALTLGRDPECQVVLTADAISRRHAQIVWQAGHHELRDLNSTNGVYVNDQRVDGSMVLHSGDRIRLGSHIFKYLRADRLEADYHEAVYRAMTLDGLTGVYNKLYVLDSLERECLGVQRDGSTLCLALMDLDCFKRVNDTYGHLAGDAVLVEFARRAKQVTRSGELLARYGGEEFALLLPRTSLQIALEIAERIRSGVAERPVTFEEQSIDITVSIGVARAGKDATVAPLELIAAADACLYQAKRQGRNRVICQQGEKTCNK